MKTLKIIKQGDLLHVITGDGLTFTTHGTINLNDEIADLTMDFLGDMVRTSYEGIRKS